ncbi:MAG: protein phosphatase 2, regulatory subunit A, partial [Paramarteilia canceri]
KYIDLTNEEMPLVRRSAAFLYSKMAQSLYALDADCIEKFGNQEDEFSKYFKNSNGHYMHKKLFPVLNRLLHDDQDMVRVIALDGFTALIDIFKDCMTQEGQEIILLPVVSTVSFDNSWKVRILCSQFLIKILTTMDYKLFIKLAEERYLGYLSDSEIEVRVRATSKMSDFVETINSNDQSTFIIQHLVPLIEVLLNTNSSFVKIALASSIIFLSKYVTKTELTTHLLNFYMALLRDPDSEISLTIMSKMCELGEESVCLKELASSLYDSISELYKDSVWRIRQDVVTLLPKVIKPI